MNLNKPDDILEEDFDNVQSNTEIPENDNVNQSNDKLESKLIFKNRRNKELNS